MKRGLLLLALLCAVPLAAQTPAEPAAARTVTVRFGDYQRLVERRRELEERLGKDRPLDAVIGRAHYDVRVGSDAAQVTARFDVKTLRPDGWKLLPLIGGNVAVSRFEAPMRGAYLVVREMLPPAANLVPGTQYLLAEGPESGELVLEFMVPVAGEGSVRRLQFTPPPVPLSTMEITLPDGDSNLSIEHVSIEPDARLEEVTGKPGGPRHVKASLRGGEPLSIVLARPEAPAAPAAPGHPAAAPRPDLAVDQLHAQWTLSDAKIRLRERLVVDVRAVPVDRLVLKKPAALANVTLREENGSAFVEESSLGRPLDPDGRQEMLEVRLRTPVAGRLVRLALTGELRADPDQPELSLAPVTVDGASAIVEGFASVASQLPHAVTLDHAEGARAVPPERLPVSFGAADGPPLVTAELTTPAPVLTLKQQVLTRARPIAGAIQRLEVSTDLSGSTVRTHYHALVSPGPDGAVTVTIPSDVGWALSDVRGTAHSDLPVVRAGTYTLAVRPGAPDPAPIDFDVKHGPEAPHGSGDFALPLARFNVPARSVTWTVQEPDHLRVWAWRGSFAESAAPHEFFLYRFAVGVWAWAGSALLGLLEPTAFFWLLIVAVGITVARSAALGRMPLDASIGQLAFLAGIVILGAVFVHVLTNAANPGAALSDAREVKREDRSDAQLRPPAPALAPRGLPPEDSHEMRRGLADDTTSAAPTRVDGIPVPQPAAPPPVLAPALPLPRAEPVMRADGTAGPTSAGGGGTSVPLAPLPLPPAMSAAPAASAPASDGRTTFARAVVLPADAALTLEATFIERRFEALATALAMLIGLGLFLGGFLALRHWVDTPSLNVGFGLGLLVLWMLDTRFPFTAPYAAAGFGLPVLLLGSVKLMGHALDRWDTWREEGERVTGRAGGETARGSEAARGGSWSASFPRSGDRNEVPIKEIFADPPPASESAGGSAPAAAAAAAVAPSDEISFVTEEDDGGESAGGEAQGGERS